MHPWKWSCLLVALAIIPLGSGCTTPSKRTEAFRAAWGSAQFTVAEAEIDRLIAEENGMEPANVGRALGGDVVIDSGDTCLFLMEKAMVRLAQDDPETAIELLRSARDELDERLVKDAGSYFKMLAAVVTDDTALDYAGADYEHIVIRVMLAISDLLIGGGDAYPYAEQVGEKQEEIIGSEFGAIDGEEEGYKPRENYRRVGSGAYLQGLIREMNLAADEACKAYQRAKQFEPGNVIYDVSAERACNGNYVSAGNGVVHVFYLGGRGPHLIETTSLPTELAIRLAGAILLILEKDPVPIAQDLVPVPAVLVNDPAIFPLEVSAGGQSVSTATILDVNLVAQEQLEANMPWIITRAVVRRVLKTLAAEVARAGAQKASDDKNVGKLVGALFNIFTTVTEVADTRNWSSLPAEIQAARLELPAGIHDVALSSGADARVRVTAGRDSYVVLLRPALGHPGVVLVDRLSRPIEEEAVPEPENIPTP